MSLTLTLRSAQGLLTVSGPGLADVATRLDSLPRALAKPYTHGPSLFQALGGDTLATHPQPGRGPPARGLRERTPHQNHRGDKTMTIPENVTLNCTYCGHEWVAPLSDLVAAEAVIYRGQAETTVRRRVNCPNCPRAINVDVPKAWLDDD